MVVRARGSALLLLASATLLVVAGGGIVMPLWFPYVEAIVVLEVGVGVLALALAWSGSVPGRALLLVVASVALSGLWFTVVDAETGGANEYAIVYWIFIGFPLMTVLSLVVFLQALRAGGGSGGSNGR